MTPTTDLVPTETLVPMTMDIRTRTARKARTHTKANGSHRRSK
jgi:hypothetical protein